MKELKIGKKNIYKMYEIFDENNILKYKNILYILN